MKKLFALMLTLVLVLSLSATVAETYSANANVFKVDGQKAVIIINGLEYKVQKGGLKEGDTVSLVMWDMKTSSKLDDVIITAMSGMHVVHVEMLGGTTPSRTTAAK